MANFTKGTRIFSASNLVPRTFTLLGGGAGKAKSGKGPGNEVVPQRQTVAKAKGSISSKSLEFGRKYRKSNKGGFVCKGHVLVNKNRKYHKNNKFRK